MEMEAKGKAKLAIKVRQYKGEVKLFRSKVVSRAWSWTSRAARRVSTGGSELLVQLCMVPTNSYRSPALLSPRLCGTPDDRADPTPALPRRLPCQTSRTVTCSSHKAPALHHLTRRTRWTSTTATKTIRLQQRNALACSTRLKRCRVRRAGWTTRNEWRWRASRSEEVSSRVFVRNEVSSRERTRSWATPKAVLPRRAALSRR